MEKNVPYHMTHGETHYSDRELIHRWAIVEKNPTIDDILAARGLKHHHANGCIGLFYVDHEEGISLRIHALCRIFPGKPPHIVVNFEDHGEDCILRYEEVGAYTLLTNDEADNLSLLEEQRWRMYYDTERLHEIRNRVDLDRFRAPGYFDDVSVILLARDQVHIPEVVWVRLEELLKDGKSFRGILLNEPDTNFGVHEGDMLTVHFAEHEDGRFLAAEIQPV